MRSRTIEWPFRVAVAIALVIVASYAPTAAQGPKSDRGSAVSKRKPAPLKSAETASATLEDFKSARNNGEETPLWSPYLGEDPEQTGKLEDGQYQLKVGKSPNEPYLHFLPRSQGYLFPKGYAQHYLTQGKWNPDFNRLTFWAKPSVSVAGREDGGGTLQVGTYIRPHDASDAAWQGRHFYHVFDVSFHAGQWHYFVLNRTPQHEVGGDSSKNWPENPVAPQVNYFDGLTRFYFDTQARGCSDSTWLFADFTFSLVDNEPDDLVASVAAVYTGKCYQVSWAGPKNIAQAYDVAYSTSSMKKAGFKRATFGGTVSNPGNAYQGTVWLSPLMAEAKALYVAIRPRGSVEFTEVMIARRNTEKTK